MIGLIKQTKSCVFKTTNYLIHFVPKKPLKRFKTFILCFHRSQNGGGTERIRLDLFGMKTRNIKFGGNFRIEIR